ncbi:MAG: ROK family protein [Balneolales bacterium]
MDLIGVDLGATNVRAARVLDGKLEKVARQKLKKEGSAGVIFDQITGLINEVKSGSEEGIGIGVPSVVDVEKGIVRDVQNIPSWKEVPLKQMLEEACSVPVCVNNDANCFVLGETYFGKARGFRNVVGLIIGTGMAAGLVLGGRLHAGPNCGAGEIGMIPYRDSILEHYSAGQFFERRYHTDGKKVFQKARQGDSRALDMYKEFGTHVGNGILVALYAYDPEIIVLGGSGRHGYPFFQQSMRETLNNFAYQNSLKKMVIELSGDDHMALLGAAALVLDTLHP